MIKGEYTRFMLHISQYARALWLVNLTGPIYCKDNLIQKFIEDEVSVI